MHLREQRQFCVPELMVLVSVPGSWCLVTALEMLLQNPEREAISDWLHLPLTCQLLHFRRALCFLASVDSNLCQVLEEFFVCELKTTLKADLRHS